MDEVMGYEDFKAELKIYILNLAEYIKNGIYELPDNMKTVFVLLGKPGTGKRGRKDSEILEGTTPAVKGAFPGRLCQGFSVGKMRMPIVLLDEFEKIAGEGLAMMMGNVLDIKKTTANYADQVPDFVQDRAKFVNIPLYAYAQRLKYVKGMLTGQLSKDPLTSEYAGQKLAERIRIDDDELYDLLTDGGDREYERDEEEEIIEFSRAEYEPETKTGKPSTTKPNPDKGKGKVKHYQEKPERTEEKPDPEKEKILKDYRADLKKLGKNTKPEEFINSVHNHIYPEELEQLEQLATKKDGLGSNQVQKTYDLGRTDLAVL
ncbi:11204_t:CDS:2 [Ambispora gerdemannii]|uniref:11204_t:CDS:1 n=1 Tax=Ambispora gerdemannii TaxID=144530 RepID=A0A9N8W586_9GLOM|nr:11204_t:CDS:2 [Ambispora gerdemannii]